MLQPGESSIYPWPVQKFCKFVALALLPLLSLFTAAPSLAAAAHKRPAKKRTVAKRPLGPRGIEDVRATEIQTALIKAGYLSGEPSGHWDAQSEAAMVKFQSDNGWQTKLVPDSRALIKLGLGPDNSGGNTSTASTAAPSIPNP